MKDTSTVKTLINWLEKRTRIIDLPRTLSDLEVEKLDEINKIELSGDSDLLDKKIKEFKNNYN